MGFSAGIDIADVVDNDALNRDWLLCLAQYEGATDQEQRECLEPVVTLRNEFIRTLSAVSDESERDMVFAVFYILLKSNWMLFNVRSGYLINSGTLDLRLMCRSGLISALLDRVEQVIPEEIIHSITEFVSQPLARVEDTDKFPLGNLHLDDSLSSQFYSLLQQTTETDIGGCSERERELAQLAVKQQSALQELVAEREIIEEEFGKISFRQVCELFRNLRHSLSSVVDQLNQVKAERQELCEKLGVSAHFLIPVQVEALNSTVEKLESELASHRLREQQLLVEFGTSDIGEIARRLQTERVNPTVYEEISEMIGSIESSFEYLS